MTVSPPTVDPAPRIEYVRPGSAALAWLAATVRALQATDPLQPITVVVPNYNAGRFARWELARRGGYVGLRTLRLEELALRLVGPPAGRGRLSSVLEASAVRKAVQAQGGVLAGLAHHFALQRELTRLFRDLRRQEVDVERLLAGELSPIGRAALGCYRAFRTLTADFEDGTGLRQRAADLLEADQPPDALAELGPTILYLPTRLDPADLRLVAGLARRVQPAVRVGLARLDDPSGLADVLPRELAERLAERLPGVVPAALPAEPPRPAELFVLRAPDPAEEVREVARRIAADVEAGRPLHRLAVLYRQTRPYAALVREALTLAGFEWSALEGRAAAESRPGRSLLLLLRLAQPGQQLTREAVLHWLDSGPRLPGPGAAVPGSAWDRHSRAAGVVHGAADWRDRLETYAVDQQELAKRRAQEGLAEQEAAALRAAGQARAMAATIAELVQTLEPPADGRRWADFVVWAEALRQRYRGGSADEPPAERPFAELVVGVLASLAEADELAGGVGPTLGFFLATLEASLEAASLPVGRLGRGVLVGPVQSIAGLAFDRVYLVGLNEGAFPPPPPIDPFFPGEGEDPLGRRERQRQRERLDFCTALAAADGGRLTLSTSDSAGGRAAFPSQWLLEAAGARVGQRLHTSGFRALRSAEQPWLRVIRSARDGLPRVASALAAWADLEDRRLAEAAAWTEPGRPLEQHPLARRAELPLGAALAVLAARRAPRLSSFDGQIGPAAAHTRRVGRFFDRRGAISASAVESWAACPFRFYLQHVLRVEPTVLPEESWTIDPLERGSLIHEVLEQFLRALRDQGRPRPDEAYTAEDRALLEQLAEARCEQARQRGLTGHPLIWEQTRASILTDLRAFLAEDEKLRRELGLTPRYLEQAFGTGDPGAWPAVELALAGGVVRFRGYIDRIDLDPDERRALVIDYKTGRHESYRELEPVMNFERMRGRAGAA